MLPRVVSMPLPVPIKEIAAGGHHTVALSADGQVFTVGCNQCHNRRGQLGHGDYAPRDSFTLIESLRELRTVRIGAGSYHTALVTADGQLWCCGDDSNGQCGQGLAPIPMRRDEGAIGGSAPTVAVPTVVTLEGYDCLSAATAPRQERVLQVSCGENHTVCLTFDTLVYSFGKSAHGNLGTKLVPTARHSAPQALSTLRGHRVVQVAAAGATTAAVTDEGRIFTWGHGKEGQLGHGNFEDRILPIEVASLQCAPHECGIVQTHAVMRPGLTDPADGRTAPAI